MSKTPDQPDSLRRAPFRGSEAIGAGLLTLAKLRGTSWRRIFRDVYVNASISDSYALRIHAATLRLPPGAVISGRSAAYLWGAELGAAADPVEILSPTRMRTSGIAIRQGLLEAAEKTLLGRIPVTTPIHTAWEIARALPPIDAIAWIDALARVKRLSTNDLVEHARLHLGEPGSRRAAYALGKGDPRAESPPESRLRLHIQMAGLPYPTPQFKVYDNGVFIARVDLAWPEIKFAIEYDGRLHIYQLDRDRARIRRLNAAGWYVYPVTALDMHDVNGLIDHLSNTMTSR